METVQYRQTTWRKTCVRVHRRSMDLYKQPDFLGGMILHRGCRTLLRESRRVLVPRYYQARRYIHQAIMTRVLFRSAVQA
jgi:hypothetical protein